MEKQPKLSRKLRRGLARTFNGEFKPQYNGKAPITKAEYDAQNAFYVPKAKPPKTRKYGVIKAILPKKTKAVAE